MKIAALKNNYPKKIDIYGVKATGPCYCGVCKRGKFAQDNQQRGVEEN